MAQLALISHVAYLKFKDEEEEMKNKYPESSGRDRRKRIINPNDPNNTQAYMLIAGGALAG